MRALITLGAKTTHGGVVSEVLDTFKVDGKALHLDGMKHYCPKCKTTVSAIGTDSTKTVMGKKMIFEGDKASCGATFQANQGLAFVGGTLGGGCIDDVIEQPLSNYQPLKQQSLTNSLTEDDKYENYYAELYKTDVYIAHKATIPSNEKGSRGVSIAQMALGAVSYFLNYRISGNELFISVSINAHPLSTQATVYPTGNVLISREGQDFGKTNLVIGEGYWGTSDNKIPVGSCTIKLPSPNLKEVKVKLELRYTAKYNETTWVVTPMPPSVTYVFSLSSFARKK